MKNVLIRGTLSARRFRAHYTVISASRNDVLSAEPAQTTHEPLDGGRAGVKGSYHGVKGALKGPYW